MNDDRADDNFRFHVEQLTNRRSRIRQHVVVLLSGSVELLPSHTYALGRGYRKSHFLRLFRLPTFNNSSDSETTLLLSILEMIMALAFRSLPEELVAKYSPKSKRPAKETNGTLECIMSFGTRNLAKHREKRFGNRVKLLTIMGKRVAFKPRGRR